MAEKQCYFCTKNQKVIDYKNAELLREFISGQMKIASRRRGGLCAKHQRGLAGAVKRARFLGLIPYTLHR